MVNKNQLGFIFETLNPIYESLLVGVTADTLSRGNLGVNRHIFPEKGDGGLSV